jgi:multidrug resistance efflux pump
VSENKEIQADVLEQTPEDPAKPAKASLNKGAVVVMAVILFSLVWYLLADRFTPYTTQARVQGYVVGVAPKVAGLLTEVWVANDEDVKAGQPLFQIDQSQYLIALQKARSDLETAKRQLEAGNASVAAARASLLAAKANAMKARQDAERLARLREEDPGTISIRRLEISQASLQQAEAAVTASEADIQRAIEQKGGDDDQSNAILLAARSAVEKAELDLSNTTVIASSDGVITDLRAEVGQFAGTGAPVLTLISLQDVWINAEFTENNLGNMRTGSSVEIIFDSLPGQVFEGRVRSLGRGVSQGNAPPAGTLPTIQNNRDWLRQSQRFPVIIEFSVSQSQDLQEQLRVGGQAAVMGYTEGHGILNLLGKFYIRLMSIVSYAY